MRIRTLLLAAAALPLSFALAHAQSAPPPSSEQGPPQGYEQGPPPSDEQGPPPGYQGGPPPGYQNGPPPGYQGGPPPGYQNGPPPGYQNSPPPADYAQRRRGGGMHMLTREQMVMWRQEHRNPGETQDQRRVEFQQFRQQFASMSPQDQAGMRNELQARWDSMPDARKQAIEQRLAQRHQMRRQQRMQGGPQQQDPQQQGPGPDDGYDNE